MSDHPDRSHNHQTIPIYLKKAELTSLAKVLLAILRQGKEAGWKVPDDLVSKALYQAIDPDAVGDWDQLT